MPDLEPEQNVPTRSVIPAHEWWTKIISAVDRPLALYTAVVLVLLIVCVVCGFSLNVAREPPATAPAPAVVMGLAILGLIVVVVDVGRLVRSGHLTARPSSEAEAAEPSDPDADSVVRFMGEDIRDSATLRWDSVWGADGAPPNVDTWHRRLRPSLYQASYYTVPTYYLDNDLNIVDYNIAFEIVFGELAGQLRGRHVNSFIEEMANADDVYEHARKFTDRIRRTGSFPFVDLERIVYDSPAFGQVEFTKVASQLHNAEGKLRGWAVALMIRQIDWERFHPLLEEKLRLDKLWSVYAGPYDRVLSPFPAYKQLIQDVIAVVSQENSHVADFGAGTGNVIGALVDKGHRVTGVENNIGMIDRLAEKVGSMRGVAVVKASVENTPSFKDAVFDAVTMVNVLYAVDDPSGCLQEMHRLLRPGGVLGLSTTHHETDLTELLSAIKTYLETEGTYEELMADYDAVYRINRDIERTIAKRHTREEYEQWVRSAGFEITRCEPSTYHNAVMLIHARKPS